MELNNMFVIVRTLNSVTVRIEIDLLVTKLYLGRIKSQLSSIYAKNKMSG